MRGYACIGLDRPKTKENVGSVLRAAYCYDAKLIVVSEIRCRYKRAGTDTMKAWRHLPIQQVTDLIGSIPYACVPVAVEVLPDAKPLMDYEHPERAFYIFGPEDGQIRNDILAHCRDKIVIPLAHCMNLAATVNVVLYDRLAKMRSAT